MSRNLFVLAIGLFVVADASANCRRRSAPPPMPVYYMPAYPLSSAVWGAPAPTYVAPPPFVPKPVVREDESPAPKAPAKSAEKPKDEPTIPKTKLPLPGETPKKILPPPSEPNTDKSPKTKEPAPLAKAVEQFLVPADRPRAEPPAEVKVGFFNHSSRDLVLVVHGEEVRLPSAQFVTLRLPRNFQWSEKGAKSADVTVPTDADGVEIVFRK